MARSRKDAWLRDELILALDLYRREGRNPSRASVVQLSELLRSMPVEVHLAASPRFRNPAGVALKVYNFVALDPAAETTGMTRGGRGDAAVFDEFAGDPARLAATAGAIRATIGSIPPVEADTVEDDIAEATEGRLLTRAHRGRERSARLAQRKKAVAMDAHGALRCEACGFDFAVAYGTRGEGFIECHHTVPLHDLAPNTRTRLDDLALLCSNCHRMVHRSAPWLTMAELAALVEQPTQATGTSA